MMICISWDTTQPHLVSTRVANTTPYVSREKRESLDVQLLPSPHENGETLRVRFNIYRRCPYRCILVAECSPKERWVNIDNPPAVADNPLHNIYTRLAAAGKEHE